MVKTNLISTDKYNVVPPYRKFKMDLKLRKNKSNTFNGTIRVSRERIPSNIENMNLNTHHQPIHSHLPKLNPKPLTSASILSQPIVSPMATLPGQMININNNINNINNIEEGNNNNNILNPFNDPPINCTESDIRWIWRKKLEERRGHIANRKYYSEYVGSKKSRKFYIEKQIEQSQSQSMYCGTHHLKHLVKIGCPKHDLKPILNELNYYINASICTHKSHICPSINNNNNNINNNQFLIKSISMKDIGLVFKRNAFSTIPLRIKYNKFSTDIYIKRIANTNFSKAFRPGSYGKLQSLKKGSWKEGKIFYVFRNDKLILTINKNIILSFHLNSCASTPSNEQNTIDGWKNITGGVGFYRPQSSLKIVSVLVLRKHQNFPLECLQNSYIKIYSNIPNPSGIIYIGSQIINLNNNTPPVTPSVTPPVTLNNNINNIKYEYNILIQRNNQLQSLNMQLIQSNNKLESQIRELQNYMTQQHQQITKLNQQIETNTFFESQQIQFEDEYPFNDMNNINNMNMNMNNNNMYL